jgi:hypothetical protein
MGKRGELTPRFIVYRSAHKEHDTQEIIVWTCAYLIELCVVIYYPNDRSPLCGGTRRGRSCRVAGNGRDRSERGHGLVAHTVCLDAIFLPLFYVGLRSRLRQFTSLPGDWLAGLGGGAWQCSLAL